MLTFIIIISKQEGGLCDCLSIIRVKQEKNNIRERISKTGRLELVNINIHNE